MEEEESHSHGANISPLVFTLLDALNQTFKDLHSDPIFTSNISTTTCTCLFDLINHPNKFPTDRCLFTLFHLLSNFKILLDELQLQSLCGRPLTNYKISLLGRAIDAEIQSHIDQLSVSNLVKVLKIIDDECKVICALDEFESRLSRGFDGDFQDMVLRAKIFPILETILCQLTCSKRVQEKAAAVVIGLCRFNRNVFVGLVFMGTTIESLISIATYNTIQVLTKLVKLVKTPLVDEIESNKQIPRIMLLLSCQDLIIRVAALDCILEIAKLGRREVIEAMIAQGLIEKLVELQRLDNYQTNEKEEEDGLFSSCVRVFTVQVEAGEGMNQREKIELKLQVLGRVRDVSVSDVEAASIAVEVLWGSSPC